MSKTANKVDNQVNRNNNTNNQLSPIVLNNTVDGWQKIANKRHHSTSSNSNPGSPRPTTSSKKSIKLFHSTNRYEILNDENDVEITQNEDPPENNSEQPIKIPPPVFIKGVENFTDLCTVLIELIGVDNFICKSSVDRLKIQTKNPESYRTLVRFLKEQKAEFHTFQLKEDKPLRVVIRNLHPTTSAETIKNELEIRLFEVRQVTNVLHKIGKNPLPLFFVDLEPTDKSKEIYDLSSLLHTKIKVEEPYKPKTISQCINCQEYGHTKAYCGYPPRCVRCGANHMSSNCSKPRDQPPKCALCSSSHPANYKGCSVYREIQQRKKSTHKSNFLYDNLNIKNFNVQQDNHSLKDFPNINHTSPKQTYAQTTSNNTNNQIPSPSLDINKVMSSFLEDLKSLINPLITLLTKVISSLLDKKND